MPKWEWDAEQCKLLLSKLNDLEIEMTRFSIRGGN